MYKRGVNSNVEDEDTQFSYKYVVEFKLYSKMQGILAVKAYNNMLGCQIYHGRIRYMGKWVAGILAAIVAGLIVWYLTEGISRRKPIITVESEYGSLRITNNSDEIIRVRVAYLYRKGGGATFCYPLPTSAQEGRKDPKMLPKETRVFQTGKCPPDFNGYNIKVWDAQYSKFLYETGG